MKTRPIHALIPALALAFAVSGCRARPAQPASETGEALVVLDLDAAMRGPERRLRVSDFADSISYIPIYDGNPAYIGGATEMEITENHLLAYDMNNRLVCYDMRNRTSRQIGTRGRGPMEYLRMTSFAADESRDIIYALVADEMGAPSSILQYTFAGQFMNSFPLPENADKIGLTAEGNLVVRFSNFSGQGKNQYAVMDTFGNTLASWAQPFSYTFLEPQRVWSNYENSNYDYGGDFHIKDRSGTLWVFCGTERLPRYVFRSEFSIDGRRDLTQADFDSALTLRAIFETGSGLVIRGMSIDFARKKRSDIDCYYDKTTGRIQKIDREIVNDLTGYPELFGQMTSDVALGNRYMQLTTGAYLTSQGFPDADPDAQWYLIVYHLKHNPR